MANIKYFIKNNDVSTIYLRLYQGRELDLKKATPFKVLNSHWNKDKQRIRNVVEATDKDSINQHLDGLRARIISNYNEDYAKGIDIDSNWLNRQIDSYFNRRSKSDLNLLTVYFQHFIDKLPYRKNDAKGGKLGVSHSTIKKYKNIKNKLLEFEVHRKKKYYVSDVNLKFEAEFISFLKGVQNLSENTIGRHITFVKTVCKDARDNGIKTSDQLNKVKGFTTESIFITLTEDEIQKIIDLDLSNSSYLDNARDWLIIGLHTGQRVSDFLSFTKDTIKNKYLEFRQKKTGSKTIVPLHENLKNVLKKHNGEFPRKISEQKFNDYIKIVSKRAGLTEEVRGARINPETKRKEQGTFPKYQLVSSHICRRSFATNHFGKLPTPVIMNITNHKSEKMFLTYIGKTPEDSAKQLEEYWNRLTK